MKTYKMTLEIEVEVIAEENEPHIYTVDIYTVDINGNDVLPFLSKKTMHDIIDELENMQQEDRDNAKEAARDFKTDQAIDEAKGA